MYKHLHLLVYVLLLPAAISVAADNNLEQSEPKLIKGMSIIGNDESPKSLYIVPWNSTDGNKEVELSSDIMKADLVPVDRRKFIRELDYYNSRN